VNAPPHSQPREAEGEQEGRGGFGDERPACGDFLDFGGTKRHPRGTKARAVTQTKMPPRLSDRGHSQIMERETGIEPATLSLGNRPDPKE